MIELDVNQAVPIDHKGHVATLERTDPHGFWRVNMDRCPKELAQDRWTNIELATVAFKAYWDKQDYLDAQEEANRKPTVAEAHYEKLMAEPELKPRKPKKVKTLSDGEIS